MGQGIYTYFQTTIASGATSSGSIDLQRSWENVYLVIPSMTSNTQHYIKASETASGTYRRIKHPAINSSTVTNNDFIIASASTNTIIPIPNGFRYVKVEATATVDDGAAYSVICGD